MCDLASMSAQGSATRFLNAGAPRGARSLRLCRVLRAPPARLYRAFLEPDAIAKWTPAHGYTGKVHALDARLGGRYRMSITHLASGHTCTFGGEYLALVPHERIGYTVCFDDPVFSGTMTTSISLRPALYGTELDMLHANVPDAIALEAFCLAWQESLVLLAQLVEAAPRA